MLSTTYRFGFSVSSQTLPSAGIFRIQRFRVNPDPTNRTDGISGQPCISAIYMKAVIACRKQSRRLIAFDLVQTYGTLRLQHQIFSGHFRKSPEVLLRQARLRYRLLAVLPLQRRSLKTGVPHQ